MEKLKMHSPNFAEENIERLAELFPNCVTESTDKDGNLKKAIDFDLLKQELSTHIVEGPQERYRLDWPGKRESLLTANAPIAKTLRPCREESVDFDTTENLFIEGDNLDALKLLQETYLGKVKMIYIDPPYNTGKDFIYADKFTIENGKWKMESGDYDDEGNRLVANTDSNGRFHSDWLSMMYPRLKLARNLLKDDGVIFISIGVEESANLKKLADEIFGENNFVEIFSWVKTSTPPALSTKSRKTNEYILCYEKNKNNYKYNGEPLDGGDAPLLNTGNTVRKLKFPKESCFFSYMDSGIIKGGKPDRVTLFQDLTILKGYSTEDFELEGEFKWTQDFLDAEIEKGTTFIIKSEKFSIRFIRKEEGYKRPTNFIKEKYTTPVISKPKNNVGTNEVASSELSALMGEEVFSYPKPVSLIKFLINFCVCENDIVMDFFAGSGTTAEAVFSWSAEKEKKLKYILVQLPENLENALKNASDANTRKVIKNGIDLASKLDIPKTIASLAKERIRRAGKQLKMENGKLTTKGASHSQLSTVNSQLDIGFRVLKVDSSNMADIYYSPDAVEQNLLSLLTDNIKDDRTAEDLLFQVLLDWGVDLTLPITKETIEGREVFLVDGNALAACFVKNGEITEDFCKELAKRQPLRVVFRDSGFKDDSVKINVEQIFKLMSPHTDVKTI